ncbi:MAG: hypothetical protein CMJ83_22615 [Planctomycetes bacterium]|nr:hypothetical protein [Planctomycetota bacterium]
MDHLLPVIVSDEIRRILPGLRIHGMRFEGARIGVGDPGLDPLRRRILQRIADRAGRIRDLAEIPSIQALTELLAELGQIPHVTPLTVLEQVRSVARRDPFPVENDAKDGALLLSLYYLMPVFLLEAKALRPPLVFLPNPGHYVLPTLAGPVQARGAPVLADDEKVLRALQYKVRRVPVHEFTKEYLLLIVDPGIDGGLDHRRTVQRAENWMSTLTRARLVRSAVSS